ncbi:MAG TPA: arylesterase [Chiayiivirga sp.]|nr:arylesterase [Chiayiivirga sp.]
MLAWMSMALAATPSRTVLVMGDSLSAAYGLAPEHGWVALIRERLKAEKPDWRVVNASVSGETTGGGAARFAAALDEHRPAVVVLELGANDALRGLPLDQAQTHLQTMIDQARAIGAKVLLVGIEIPPNYGPDYTAALQAMYRKLAADNALAFLPFLLEPIAADLANFQADGLHPTARAQPAVRDHVWKSLEPLLD